MTTATTSKAQETISTTTAVTLDTKGLKAAARFLERQDYGIVERNWECKSGSVDLIAKTDNTLVFVEVKTRTNENSGLPVEDTSSDRRSRWEKIAIAYLANSDFNDVAIRFDAVSILVVSEDRAFLRHHINAFSIGE